MRLIHVLLLLAILVLAWGLVLYFVIDATATLAFWASWIAATLTVMVILRRVEIEGYEHLIIRRVGRFRDPYPRPDLQGGRFYLIRMVDVPVRVDMRPRTETVEHIKCYSQDNVDLDMSYFFRWRVANPLIFLLNSPGLDKVPATLAGVATETLLDIVGRMSLQDVLQKRQNIAKGVRFALEDRSRTDNWGLRVEQVGLGEIAVPPNIAEAMARQAVAHLIAKARTVEAQGAVQDLNQMQKTLTNPSALDRAVLLQIMRGLSDAIAQRK